MGGTYAPTALTQHNTVIVLPFSRLVIAPTDLIPLGTTILLGV